MRADPSPSSPNQKQHWFLPRSPRTARFCSHGQPPSRAVPSNRTDVERLDDREDYGEERFVIIGMAEGNVVLFVAYTEREECIRIISARRATQYEQDDYFRQSTWSTPPDDRRSY